MKIDKDNYEEYFLLFADNELSGEEKDIVEDFVKQNAEFEEEFLNIKQSVLQPENDLKLVEKSFLFRHSGKQITHLNYLQYFIQYHDNELTVLEKNETEVFLLQNPSLKNDFQQFKNCKLQPADVVTFPYRHLLLKREGKIKTMPFGWWKAAAAAALTGIMLSTAIYLFKEDSNEITGIVKNTNAEKKGNARSLLPDTANARVITAIKESTQQNYSLPEKALERTDGKVPVKQRDIKNEQVAKIPARRYNMLKVSAGEKIAPKELDFKDKENEMNDNVNPGAENFNTLDNDNEEAWGDVMVPANTNDISNVRAVSYVSVESEESNNYAFYNVTEEKFNKSKVGGFLRKVKRMVGRKISPLSNSKDRREMVDN